MSFVTCPAIRPAILVLAILVALAALSAAFAGKGLAQQTDKAGSAAACNKAIAGPIYSRGPDRDRETMPEQVEKTVWFQRGVDR